ncbi:MULTISPECIES: 2-oxo-tetronate isomerase [unclassified Marinobacterium]|uniref:2-oxo-tetronate isomerase n=1 Tax=unclassified Marinobacterium TaxID=2644139 RepID=UPI00156A70C9|nr:MULTISPECIES: 2-oxo-tetronate isomerase [unclassified Marinobacterium]NRP10270.1 Hydroxypyruvate isomerase [Marinobacterium sp. xm-g-48]NRP15641.1 Hydroxypyruvate isomerase [Marinobacterium sp. xm-a-152]NRP27665.1 Hydroxypyruvate isomerase [Marinobacterium sp. xm-d-420]NRP37161.1 Hydroxypyruvate isomerase [Marinobacterium sp. xm-d-579]NRP38245.1 Hydroxypyruvate isomerase [Marinobacterium sp. xm-a-121]
MLNFAANLSFLFSDLPFLERFVAAKKAGFDSVEYLFPYDYPAEQIKDLLNESGLEQALFNASAGDWGAGERGLAALVGRESEFKASIEQAASYAEVLGNRRLHIMSGLADFSDPKAFETYLNNLTWAADQLNLSGINVLIEPINSRDMPGYFLTTPEQAAEVIELANRTNLKMQFDLYHAQIMCGDLITRLERYWPLIDHMQIASVPDRNEPSSGEINYSYLFNWLDQKGYQGFIGCEYRPKTTTLEGLGWLSDYKRSSNG